MTYSRLVARNHPLQVMKRGAIDAVDDRRTPQALFDRLHERFRFTIDVAASVDNAMLDRYYTRADDGLVAMSWARERVWCNPPYSNIAPWVEKAHNEVACGSCPLVVMLLPANRTDQPWWQQRIECERDGRRHEHAVRTEFLPGRIRFTKPDRKPLTHHDRPLFGCVLLIWGIER